MKKKKYEPGVYYATVGEKENVVGMVFRRTGYAALPNEFIFTTVNQNTGKSSAYSVPEDPTVANLRRAIVIDVANVRRIGDLVGALRGTGWNDIADQIAAQAPPPKPQEPTGIGSVAKDSDDHFWTRADVDEVPWFNAKTEQWENWGNIDVVQVLSRGINLE